MSFKDIIKSNDDLAISVKRYNPDSISNRIGRFFDGLKHPTEKENHIFPTPDLKEHTHNCGFLTATARRWDEGVEDYGDWFYLAKNKHNLLTTAGRDFFHQQCYKDTGLGASGTAYVAVSATSYSPAAGDTTITTELAANGFSRVLGTYAHTATTNATTITTTFTATGAQSNVQASGLFTAVSAGTLSHVAVFTSTTFATNDQLQITWTLNLG